MAYEGVTSGSDPGAGNPTTGEPAGAAEGWILLAVVNCEDNATATVTPATDWAQVPGLFDEGTGTGQQLMSGVYWIRRGASPAATNWTISAGGAARIASIVGYSGRKATGDPWNGTPVLTLGSDASAEYGSITTTVDGCDIVALQSVFSWNGAVTFTGGWNQRLDQAGAGPGSIHDQTQATAGATPALTVSGDDNWVAHLIALAPFVAVVPEAPTITFKGGGHTRAGLEWTAGYDGGEAVTDWDIDAATEAAPTTWLGVQATGSTNLYGAYTGLTNGTPYVFRVRAVNSVGDGAWSGTSAAATPSDVRGFFLLEDGTSKFLLEDGTDRFLLEAGAGDVGGDATATPAAIAATVTMTAATLSAGSTVAPTEIVATATQNAVVASAGSTPTPATIVAVAALDAVTLSAGSTSTPATIVVPAALDTPTLSAGSTVTTTEIVVSVVMDAVAAGAAAVTTPATIIAAAVMDAATTSAGSTPTPATIIGVVSIDTPTLSAGSTPTPGEIVAMVTMEPVAASGSGEATATPATIIVPVTMDAATLSAGSTVAVAELVAVAFIDAVATTAGGTGTSATIVALTTLDQATPSASSTTAPVTVIAVATIDPVTATGENNATATPATIVAFVTIDPVTATGNIVAIIGGHGTGTIIWRDGGVGAVTGRDSATAAVVTRDTATSTVAHRDAVLAGVGAAHSGTGGVSQP